MTIKELVAPSNRAQFVKYFDGQLWYQIVDNDGDGTALIEFPVPISDIGTATFLAEDKAILFMRYIRKHLDMINKAKQEQGC